MMDFFERLRERAKDKFYEKGVAPDDLDGRVGIYATIEALKEMMVAAMRRPIVHYGGKSWFVPGISLVSFEQEIDNGEEVVVMVFKGE